MARETLSADETKAPTTVENADGVPRWPATIAILMVGCVLFFVSSAYTLGPRGGILALIAALLIPLWVLRSRGLHHWTHAVALTLNSVLTLAVASSAALLVYRLSEG